MVFTGELKMNRRVILAASALLLAAGACLMNGKSQAADMPTTQPTSQPSVAVPPVLRFKMTTLVGNKPVDLATYQGKVLLLVNTASKCGNTHEYENLENLNDKYKGKGLEVLGFPSNDFGGQEPGTDLEIAAFCKETYDVKFDMFSKVDVKGANTCDLYKFLTSKKTNPKFAGDITWNFEKFLVARDGTVVGRYDPKMNPEDPKIVSAIETELAK
jgi:glutathione peroxidase